MCSMSTVKARLNHLQEISLIVSRMETKIQCIQVMLGDCVCQLHLLRYKRDFYGAESSDAHKSIVHVKWCA